MSRRNNGLELSVFKGTLNCFGYQPEIAHKRCGLCFVIVLPHGDKVVVFVIHQRKNIFGRPCKCIVCCNV